MADELAGQLTPVEKLAACIRICGKHVGPDTHRMAPEMCPVLLDYWHNPVLRDEARERERQQCDQSTS